MALQQEARLRQQLNLTPSMQQALKVLQMSYLDLEEESRRLLEENIFLEQSDATPEGTQDVSTVNDNSANIVSVEKPDPNTPPESTEHIDETDYYTARQEPIEPRNHSYDADPDFDIFSTIGTSQTLLSHMLEQIPNNFSNQTEQTIAQVIAYNLDDNGYLDVELEEIAELSAKVVPVTMKQVNAVHQRFMHLSPAGIGAQNPRQCLRVQLEEMNRYHNEVQDALLLVNNHLEELAFDIRNLMRSLKWDRDRFDAARARIRQCYGHPADKLGLSQAHYIQPDVVVKNINGTWEAFLVHGQHHGLKVNDAYIKAVKTMKATEGKQELQKQFIDAKTFILSLQQRDQTLLATAREIVREQQTFFDKGPIALKPLTLADIAERIGFHESTISRATSGKYMLTPGGTVELKSFFDRGMGTGSAEGVSATELKERIRSLIDSEPPTLRLSDQRISKMLEHQGYKVARRTVAKYRESMNIPSSSDRSYRS